MKYFVLAALAIAYVNAECACMESDSDDLPPADFFTGEGYAEDYGQGCAKHDEEADYCQEDGENAGEDWCTAEWCYVVDGAECDDAEDTLFFADTEYSEIQWAMAVCESEDNATALYASMAALSVVVAASI